ncbi:MAG: hypothetical protein ACI4TK_05150 [Agathobacter sp.]
MAILVILLMLVGLILFIGMANRNNYTQAFCVVVAAVALLLIFG